MIRNDYGPFAPAIPSAEDFLQIENQIPLSEGFNFWSLFHIAVTTGQADPLGGTSACKLTTDGTAFASAGVTFVTTQAGPITFSIWMKAGSGNKVTPCFADIGGTPVLLQAFIGLDNGWQRYSIRLAAQAAGTTRTIVIFPGLPGNTDVQNMYVFGAQVNSGNEVQGYIQTLGAAAAFAIGKMFPLDIRVGRDITLIRDLIAGRDVYARIGNWSQENVTTFGFAADTLVQTAGGYAGRWTLANNGTYRLQIYSAYPSTLADTPFTVDASGHIQISTLAAQGNLVIRGGAFAGGNVPSFNAGTGLFDPVAVIASGAAAGGDLSGTYPNPTVAKIQGRAVLNAAPANGDVLTWVAANNDWEPAASGASGFVTAAWTSYTPSTTNLSGVSTDAASNHSGKTCFVNIKVVGTSNGTSPTIGLPFTANDANRVTFACYVSTGGATVAGVVICNGTTVTVSLYNNTALANGNTYTIVISGVYETT